jgi:hypothetical protein
MNSKYYDTDGPFLQSTTSGTACWDHVLTASPQGSSVTFMEVAPTQLSAMTLS